MVAKDPPSCGGQGNVSTDFPSEELSATTHYDLVKVVEKVGTVAGVYFGRLEARKTFELGRCPFPNTTVMAV